MNRFINIKSKDICTQMMDGAEITKYIYQRDSDKFRNILKKKGYTGEVNIIKGLEDHRRLE